MLEDAKRFMESAGQTVDSYNDEQVEIYSALYSQEIHALSRAWMDLEDAMGEEDLEAEAALRGQLSKHFAQAFWLLAGFGYSIGLPLEEAMQRFADDKLSLPDPRQGLPVKNW